MKRIHHKLLAAFALAVAALVPAAAQAPRTVGPARSGQLGQASSASRLAGRDTRLICPLSRTTTGAVAAPAAAATETIAISPDTEWVNVTGGDTVKFIANDKQFAWSFSGDQAVSAFPLNRVAPAGALNHAVMAYVAPDPRYIGGGDAGCGH